MNFKFLTVPLLASLVAACGGDSDLQTITPKADNPDLIYSYPSDGQRNVSPVAPVVLRFSEPVDPETVRQSAQLKSANGNLQYTVETLDGGRSIMLQPIKSLSVGTDYEVIFDGPVLAEDGREIRNLNSNLINDVPGIQFVTRGGFTGFGDLDSLPGDFGIASMIPAPDTLFEPSDLSTFRLELTRAVHPEWKAMGGSIKLLNEGGEEVSTNIFVKDRRVSVDPCTAETLDGCGLPQDKLSGDSGYSLVIKNLPAISGERLTVEKQFIARKTAPTAVQFQNVTDPGITEGNDDLVLSKLNGQPVNGVILNSVLQGTTEASESGGGLFSELAFAPSYGANEGLPIRIPRGSQLTGSSLGVRVNGTVSVLDEQTGALQQTGDINVVMVSDATGYLLPNLYTDDPNAPRHVRLFMDASMNTEAAQPNASLSQDILHAELVGVAIVEDGVLVIDAIGIVEPTLLGQEVTSSIIAFQITADTSVSIQMEAIDTREPDRAAPSLVSWLPGPVVEGGVVEDPGTLHRPGDPISLYFNEPILESTVSDGVILKEGQSQVPLKYQVDGTTVTINPEGGLKHGVPYMVELNSSLTDLAGNGVPQKTLQFALPDLGSNDSNVSIASPLPLTTYPGYPCVTVGQDFENNKHGQCTDGAPDGPLGETLPLSRLPENRPIAVVFSQSIEKSTVRLGETFKVEHVNRGGNVEPVAGRLEFSNQRIRFFPDKPWVNGELYRYTMASSEYQNIDDVDCSNSICGENNLPIQTNLLVDPEDFGGPNLEIHFRGKPAVESVLTPLRNLPVRDANSNYVVDCNNPEDPEDCLEPSTHETYPDVPDAPGVLTGSKPSENSAKLVLDGDVKALGLPIPANVGCEPGEACPDNKFLYVTYALNIDLAGPLDPEDFDDFDGEGIEIQIYPTVIATTSNSVFLTGFGEQATGPTILRMRHQEVTSKNPEGLVIARIVEGPDGRPRFEATAPVSIDAPNLSLPVAALLSHDVYSKEFDLELAGPVQFFDDGRLLVTLDTIGGVELTANVDVEIPVVSDLPLVGDLLELVTGGVLPGVGGLVSGLTCLLDPGCSEPSGPAKGIIEIPLSIPAGGGSLKFLSFPIKQIPEEHALGQ